MATGLIFLNTEANPVSFSQRMIEQECIMEQHLAIRRTEPLIYMATWMSLLTTEFKKKKKAFLKKLCAGILFKK